MMIPRNINRYYYDYKRLIIPVPIFPFDDNTRLNHILPKFPKLVQL
jgi:hypothetical protein